MIKQKLNNLISPIYLFDNAEKCFDEDNWNDKTLLRYTQNIMIYNPYYFLAITEHFVERVARYANVESENLALLLQSFLLTFSMYQRVKVGYVIGLNEKNGRKFREPDDELCTRQNICNTPDLLNAFKPNFLNENLISTTYELYQYLSENQDRIDYDRVLSYLKKVKRF